MPVPDLATALTETPCSVAMKPSTLNTTKPVTQSERRTGVNIPAVHYNYTHEQGHARNEITQELTQVRVNEIAEDEAPNMDEEKMHFATFKRAIKIYVYVYFLPRYSQILLLNKLKTFKPTTSLFALLR